MNKGFGWVVAVIAGVLVFRAVVIALGWNLGLYGAGIVDNKIDFQTGLGLALLFNLVTAAFFSHSATMKVMQNDKS